MLPDFSFSVVSDPTISEYQGHVLLGHYEIDDEGVPAQRVSLIEKGTLVNYLIGREPIRDFPVSNGHARAQIPIGAPGPHNSNLIVTSSTPTPKAELKKKLIEICLPAARPAILLLPLETCGPKLTPRLLYKIWTKDGHEELISCAAPHLETWTRAHCGPG